MISVKNESNPAISKTSKFQGHTGTISHIIQIKSKKNEKEKRKNKFKIATTSWDSTIKLWDFDSNSCIGTLNGHVGAVYCIRQLRDYKEEKKLKCKMHKIYLKKLVSCGLDQTIRIWDLKNLKCLKIFQGHKNIIESVIQIKDKIYSASHDKEIKIWNLSAKKDLNANSKQDQKEKCDSETSDEDDILYSKKAREINQNLNLDLDHYQNIKNTFKEAKDFIANYSNKYYSGNLLGHTDILKCLQKIKIKNKYYLLSGSHDKSIILWNVKRKYCEKTLNGHEHCVNSIIKLKWKLDDFSIASGSLDKSIKLWNLKTAECFYTINNAHDDCINKLIYLKWRNEENVIISGSDDKSVKIWNIDYDNKKQNNFQTRCFKVLKYNGNAEYVNALKQMKWGRDETTILTGGKDNEITIWS